MAKLLTYEQKDTWMDRLCGVTKLIYFLAWSITSMLTYDTRVLAVMLVLSLILFKISKTEWKQVGSIFKFIMFFLVINVLAILFLHRIREQKFMVQSMYSGSFRHIIRLPLSSCFMS